MGEEFDRRKGALTEDDSPEVEGHRRKGARSEEPEGDEFDRRKGALTEDEEPDDDPGRWHGR